MDDVLLLVVSGNLRHRIELLGCEKRYEDMTEAQRILHDAAKLQGHAWGADLDPEAKPERPRWANGAFVYLLPEHTACIERAVRDAGENLQSKHMLVSEELKETLKRTLDAKPEGSGREGYQIRRAGEVSRQRRIPLPGYTFEDLHNMRKGEAEAGLAAFRREDPHCAVAVVAAAAAPKAAVPFPSSSNSSSIASRPPSQPHFAPPPPPPPPRRSEVHMLQLKKEQIMEDRDLDEELLEYLTAPPSVQMLSPETWLDVWQHVCRENQDWLEMRDDPRCGPCPYCRICKRWAELSHLRSEGCESRRREEGITRLGHVLRAILEAEKNRGNSTAYLGQQC